MQLSQNQSEEPRETKRTIQELRELLRTHMQTNDSTGSIQSIDIDALMKRCSLRAREIEAFYASHSFAQEDLLRPFVHIESPKIHK